MQVEVKIARLANVLLQETLSYLYYKCYVESYPDLTSIKVEKESSIYDL